ncbi:hypothetical protein CPC08DRAFT_768068 [Agrocybe pediades]|nr:hypothetical protein CPC08DRAFT_768068 [Agrocybe pediades]
MDLTTPDNGADSTTGAATITTPTALTIDMPSATSTTAGPEALTAPPNLIFITTVVQSSDPGHHCRQKNTHSPVVQHSPQPLDSPEPTAEAPPLITSIPAILDQAVSFMGPASTPPPVHAEPRMEAVSNEHSDGLVINSSGLLQVVRESSRLRTKDPSNLLAGMSIPPPPAEHIAAVLIEDPSTTTTPAASNEKRVTKSKKGAPKPFKIGTAITVRNLFAADLIALQPPDANLTADEFQEVFNKMGSDEKARYETMMREKKKTSKTGK